METTQKGTQDGGALERRAQDFTLAALATAYPTAEVAHIFNALQETIATHRGLAPMLVRLRGGVDALQADYLDRFDHGQERVALYETEYGRMRGLSKGKDLADIVGFYRAFGFDLEEGDDAEMPDHLAVELEFYGILLYKSMLLTASGDNTGHEIVEDARRKFLIDHLGGFVRAISQRPGVANDPVYGPLLGWCADLVAEECLGMGAVPAPLDFFAQDDAGEVANCGGCVAIPGLTGPDPLGRS